MTRPLVLRGGRVIDPSRDLDQPADVLIQDGKIAGLGASLGTPDGAEVRDVRGKVVAPGLVDVHVHLRERRHPAADTAPPPAAARGPPAPRPPPTPPGAPAPHRRAPAGRATPRAPPTDRAPPRA